MTADDAPLPSGAAPAPGPEVPGSSAPGWYPAEDGFVRWWDGTSWGPPRPAGTDGPVPRALPTVAEQKLLPGAVAGDHTRALVMLSHLGFVLGWFIMPLSVYLVEKTNPYVRHHAAEALNFQLTVLIVVLLSLPLMLLVVGFFTLLAAVVADVVLGIVAAVQAGRGVWFRYPVNLRLVRP